jgi:hypothetical protein
VPADGVSCLTGIYDRGKIRLHMRLFDRIREALSLQGGKERKKMSDRPQDDEDEEEIEELIALDII